MNDTFNDRRFILFSNDNDQIIAILRSIDMYLFLLFTSSKSTIFRHIHQHKYSFTFTFTLSDGYCRISAFTLNG